MLFLKIYNAYILTENHTYEEAEKAFEKAISLDPKNVQSYINLGMVKYSKGEKPEAKKLWK